MLHLQELKKHTEQQDKLIEQNDRIIELLQQLNTAQQPKMDVVSHTKQTRGNLSGNTERQRPKAN